MKADNGRIDVTFLPEEQAKARLQRKGSESMAANIEAVTEEYFAVKDQIPDRMKNRSHDIKIAQPAKRQAVHS